MRRQIATAIAVIIILCAAVSQGAYAAVTVGVKEGDWIEYQVTFTGDSSQGHDVNWARIAITAVHEKAVTINITTMSSNGTLSYEPPITLNFEAGALGDDFIIPANLNVGDSFFDRNQGNITITGAEEKTVAGVQRNVISGSTPQTTYYWDQLTGVVVEANSSYPSYTIATKADKTNIWEPKVFGLSATLFYVVIGVSAVVAVAAAAILLLKRRKQASGYAMDKHKTPVQSSLNKRSAQG
jgi:hypothetical protein